VWCPWTRTQSLHGWLALVLASVQLVSPSLSRADSDTAAINELKGMSVEQLTNVQVYSVARHAERVLDTASAVQVITQEDIRRSGATSLAEVLRLADNLQVAQKNSHDWAISARGFNTALANKLLVMIDGRTVYSPLFSGVYWDIQDYLLEDIERIEVISGPGGTLWGANAVNGVINIITKSAKDTQGAYVQGGGGSDPQALAGARFGGSLSPGTYFRVYGKYVDRDAETLADGRSASDNWHQARGGFRLDSTTSARDNLTLQGDTYDGHENEPAGGTADTSGGNLLGRWSRVFSADSDMSLQSYLDVTHVLDPEPPLTLGTLALTAPGFLRDDLTTYDIDFQHRFAVGQRNRIVWGLGYRYTHDVVGNAPGIGFLPTSLTQSLYSQFIQDEIALQPNLSFTLGAKLEHNDYTGWELQPNARLRWSFVQGQALWAAVSRAVRTPSRVDRDLYEAPPPAFSLLQGSSDFVSEKLIAYEFGYRGQFTSRLSSSVSTFYNVYSDLRSTSYTPVTIVPLFFANNLEGHSYGMEATANYQALPNWSLHAGYTLLQEHLWIKPGQTDINDGLNETADPKHQVSLRSSLDLPRQVQFDTSLRWVDALHINSGATLGTVPSYFELNSRLAWQATQQLELALAGENLLHARHPEYGFPSPARVEIARSVYAKATWRY
jgi:iron complex outermembrane receptor protein